MEKKRAKDGLQPYKTLIMGIFISQQLSELAEDIV